MTRIASRSTAAGLAALALGTILACSVARADEQDSLTAEIFAAVAFADGPEDAPLIRVVGDVAILVSGATAHVPDDVLDRLLDDLRRVTGLPIDRVGDSGEIGDRVPVRVHFAPRGGRDSVLGASWISSRTVRTLDSALCAFVARGRETVREVLIVIDPNLPAATIAHCVVEEVAQSFGAFNDTLLLQRSAFNDRGPLIDALEPADLRLLSLLYDPRIAPGMSRSAVMALIPGMLEEGQ